MEGFGFSTVWVSTAKVLGIHANPCESSFSFFLSLKIPSFLCCFAGSLIYFTKRQTVNWYLPNSLSAYLGSHPFAGNVFPLFPYFWLLFSANALYSNLVAVYDCITFKHGPCFLPFVSYNSKF